VADSELLEVVAAAAAAAQHWASAVRQLLTTSDMSCSWKLPDAGTCNDQETTSDISIKSNQIKSNMTLIMVDKPQPSYNLMNVIK